jgi:hypothetical protein
MNVDSVPSWLVDVGDGLHVARGFAARDPELCERAMTVLLERLELVAREMLETTEELRFLIKGGKT